MNRSCSQGQPSRRKKITRLFRLANTVVCFAAVTILGFLMRSAEDGFTSSVYIDALFYLSVLITTGWLFYMLAPLMRNKTLSAGLFTVLFVWGCVLYFRSPVKESDVIYSPWKIERQIEAPNRAVASFFPSRGGFEAIAKADDAALRLHYFIFQTAVLFYVALLMFSIFGRGIVNQARKWVTPWRRLNVFWGRSDAGMLLARNIMETSVRDQVFFMLQQRSGDGDEWRTLTHDIDRMDAMWAFTYDSNAVESDVSHDTLAQAKGRRHFFLDESGYVNVSRADRLVKVLREWKDTRSRRNGFWCFFSALRAGIHRWYLSGCREKPFFYVRVESSADELTYKQWASSVRDVVTPILISESQLVAKDFIAQHPMLKMPRIVIDTENAVVKEGEFNVLLVGFGATGQSILNEIVCNSQFVRSYDSKTGLPITVPLHVDIVEQDKKVVEEYCIRHPLATRHPVFSPKDDPVRYDVNFVEDSVRVEDKTFDDWFRRRLAGGKNPYNRIIVCLKGDEKTIGISGKIIEFARRQGVEIEPGVVFARVKDPARNRYLHTEKDVYCSIFSRGGIADERVCVTPFGNLHDIYSFGRINVEIVDTMAKVLNSRYGDYGRELAAPEQREAAWENASFFDQLSSRASAEGQRNMLMLLGWSYRAKGRSAAGGKAGDVGTRVLSAEDIAGRLREGSDLLRTLAIDEHLRWNAFHIMMGYRPWNVLDMSHDARNDMPVPWPSRFKANQLRAIGKHADIVPFEKLPDVDMQLKEWDTGRSKSEFNRKDFEGLKPDSSQAWDYAFCQIVGHVANAAGLDIVAQPQPNA